MKTSAIALLFTIVCCCLAHGQQKRDEPSAAERIERATQNMSNKQLYQLAYKLKKDETVRWAVEHVASTKTQMAGETEETSSRSVSIKAWKVSSVDSLGNMTFVHTIESVDMWQQIGEDEPVAYNSKTDTEVPVEYESVAEKLGKPLAIISISPNGDITDRKSNLKGATFGVGDVTVPLPNTGIPIGKQWNVPTQLSATDEEGRSRSLKARISYELMKVKSGNAYISFRTEVLTPVESEKIKSQIMQQMTKGYIVFDIAAGRPIRKEVEWDEKVQGYEGPDSYLQYLGRMSEKLVVDSGQQANSHGSLLAPIKTEIASEPASIKTRDGEPLMRK